MPEKTGRTGRPGNSTIYHSIEIKTAHPEKLQFVKSSRTVKTYTPGFKVHESNAKRSSEHKVGKKY